MIYNNSISSSLEQKEKAHRTQDEAEEQGGSTIDGVRAAIVDCPNRSGHWYRHRHRDGHGNRHRVRDRHWHRVGTGIGLGTGLLTGTGTGFGTGTGTGLYTGVYKAEGTASELAPAAAVRVREGRRVTDAEAGAEGSGEGLLENTGAFELDGSGLGELDELDPTTRVTSRERLALREAATDAERLVERLAVLETPTIELALAGRLRERLAVPELDNVKDTERERLAVPEGPGERLLDDVPVTPTGPD